MKPIYIFLLAIMLLVSQEIPGNRPGTGGGYDRELQDRIALRTVHGLSGDKGGAEQIRFYFLVEEVPSS